MLLMSKGSKETLTVLIVTHVTHVERVERLHYVHNIDTFNAMLKCRYRLSCSNGFRRYTRFWASWSSLGITNGNRSHNKPLELI